MNKTCIFKINTLSLTIAALFLLSLSHLHAQPLDFNWSKGLYSTQTSFTTLSAYELELDDNDNIYIAGIYQGTVDLDPGAGNTTIQGKEVGFGGRNNFIAKYDKDGNILFGYDVPYTIAHIIIANNNLYIIGTADTIVDLDFSATVNELNATTKPYFLAKYDLNGNYQAVNIMVENGSNLTSIEAAKMDSKNGLILYGRFKNTVDFDPSGNAQNLSVSGSGSSTFLAKYTSGVALKFVFEIKSNNTSTTQELEIDSKDQIYISGRFGGSGTTFLDLDPGPGNTNIASKRGVDSYWGKYSPDGTYLNGNAIDGSIFRMRFDQLDNIYLTGSTTDSMDIDFTAKTFYIYNRNVTSNSFDLYIAKYDSSLNLQYAKTFDAASNTARVEDMLINRNQEFYMVGEFLDTLGFEKGSLQNALFSKGNKDAFIVKFDPSGKVKFAHSFGNTNFEEIFRIKQNYKGELFFIGQYSDSINLDPTSNIASALRKEGDGGAMFYGKYKDHGTIAGNTVLSEGLRIEIHQNHLWVQNNMTKKGPMELDIYSSNGQKINSFIFTGQEAFYKIPLKHLPKGMVFTVLLQQENYVMHKSIYILQ